VADDPRLNHRAEVEGGVLADESAALLKAFFAARRRTSAAPAADEAP
jgi:tRNA(adenine34) deaminase